jgi:hypothetical protein
MRAKNMLSKIDCDLEPIAERVMRDVSGRMQVTTVITVLRRCAAANPGATPEFIEQATRAQLGLHHRRGTAFRSSSARQTA